ncbi:MAG: hypothetical protein CMM01_09235 [Rhodopirellula sp.]|nr:hypothetical protein [Rhodopirellula sp.]
MKTNPLKHYERNGVSHIETTDASKKTWVGSSRHFVTLVALILLRWFAALFNLVEQPGNIIRR